MWVNGWDLYHWATPVRLSHKVPFCGVWLWFVGLQKSWWHPYTSFKLATLAILLEPFAVYHRSLHLPIAQLIQALCLESNPSSTQRLISGSMRDQPADEIQNDPHNDPWAPWIPRWQDFWHQTGFALYQESRRRHPEWSQSSLMRSPNKAPPSTSITSVCCLWVPDNSHCLLLWLMISMWHCIPP